MGADLDSLPIALEGRSHPCVQFWTDSEPLVGEVAPISIPEERSETILTSSLRSAGRKSFIGHAALQDPDSFRTGHFSFNKIR